GPSLMSGRGLAPVLLPRPVLVTAPPVILAPPPVPQRPLRRPTAGDLAVGRSVLDGGLLAVDVGRVTSGGIFGLSGGGKSSVLTTLMLSDIMERPAHGLILVDPHSDLAAKLLPWIPAGRLVVDVNLDDEADPGRWGWT